MKLMNFFNKQTSPPKISSLQLIAKIPALLPQIPEIVTGLWHMHNIYEYSQKHLAWYFAAAVNKNPFGTAILYGNLRFTFMELDEWSNQLAHCFQSHKISKGKVVALLLENRPELLACILALAKLGAISALVNPQQRGTPLQHSIQVTRCKTIIVGHECIHTWQSLIENNELTNTISLRFFLADQDTSRYPGTAPEGWINLGQQIQTFPTTALQSIAPIYARDPCFYLFTSGTTGLPKASIISHRRCLKASIGIGKATLQLTPDDILYCPLPLFHGTALILCWTTTLVTAAGFAFRRKFSAQQFWTDARKFNATAMGYVGEICRYLLAQPNHLNERKHHITKMVGNGLRPSLWNSFKRRFKIEKIYELYGSSEGNIGFINFFNFDRTIGLSPAKYALVNYDATTAQPIRNRSGFCQPVASGEPGLLITEINKTYPLDGYTESKATKRVVLVNVFKTGDRWFNTGDLLRHIGFGQCQFVDRLGDTFRWKGENVSTTEVENIIANFPGIKEAVVYGVEIPHTNGKAGMATLTLEHPRQEFHCNQLFEFLQTQLPEYAIPIFIRIQPNISLTDSFKYNKNDLKRVGFETIKNSAHSLWVRLPKQLKFQPMTDEIQQQIHAGEYSF